MSNFVDMEEFGFEQGCNWLSDYYNDHIKSKAKMELLIESGEIDNLAEDLWVEGRKFLEGNRQLRKIKKGFINGVLVEAHYIVYD